MRRSLPKLLLIAGLAVLLFAPGIGVGRVGHTFAYTDTGTPTSAPTNDTNDNQPAGSYTLNTSKSKYYCGDKSKDDAIQTSINIGCRGKGNALLDMIFAFIRFLSAGAGLFIIGSLIVGGIQYTTARGDPQALTAASNRIRTVLISLLIFIFAYAILNYLIPGQLLK